ncbi:hypothetical protein ACHQM5_012466 [Ranunculus cassubicifolius]
MAVTQKTPTSPSGSLSSSEEVKPAKRKIVPLVVGKWTMRDLAYAFFIVVFHVLCLFAPYTFTWGAFTCAYLLYVLTMFSITFSYHRNLAHRSFNLPKYLEYLFAYFALHAYQGDPVFWVSAHRYHHNVTDTERDPHSPTQGFLFSHIGWILDFNKILKKGVNYANVRDLTRQPYYMFLRHTMGYHVVLLGVLIYAFGGFPYLVWGMGVRTVWTYHVTFAVNSVCHTWGRRVWNTPDLSKNTWWLCLATFGESWHNNHHAFDYSARHGLEWWQIDLPWYVIKLLEYLGLATDVKLPTGAHKQRLSLDAKHQSSK